MRKVLIVCLVPVVLVGAVVLAASLVPLNSLRTPVEQAVSKGLGRGVHIAGALHASLYPEIGLTAGDVSIDNVAGGEAREFAHVATLAVGAKLVPLLSRQIDITRLALEKPVIHLEVDKNGAGNWNFGAAKSSADNSSSLSQLSISGLKISGGQISYADARTGKTKALSDVNASLSLAAMDQPAVFALDATYDNDKLSVTGRIDSPKTYLQKEPTKIALDLTSRLVTLHFDGSVIGATQSSGLVRMSGPSLRQLMQASGTAAPDSTGLGAFSLAGQVSSKDRVYALSGAKLALDGMNANLDISVDLTGKVPALKGKIALDRLDAGAYMTGKKTETATQGWSTAPLSLNGLKLADADLAITVEQFLLGKFVITHSAMHVSLQDARLTADLGRAALFNGSATGQVVADASGSVPTFTIKADVKSVAMKALLQSAMKIQRIEGTGLLAMNVTGRGTSQQAIVNSLGGTGSVTVRDGAIRGVDLAAVARTVQNALSGALGAATSERSSTDFAEAGGKFVIRGGVMHNDDFHLLNPFVRIAGSGDINLGQRTIDFRIEPKVVTTGAGQGGARNAAGLGIPFQISGPWTKPSYRPDLKAVGGAILNQLTGGTGGVGGLLGGALGGKKSGTGQSQPGLDLKGLFGR